MQKPKKIDREVIYIEEALENFEKNTNAEEVIEKYAWEQDVERSWNLLVDVDGVLRHVDEPHNTKVKEKYVRKQSPAVRRGIFRHVFILFDMSCSMKELDFSPDRINVALECTEAFLKNFFLKNPVGRVGIVTLKNNSAKLIQPLTSTIKDIIDELLKERKAGLVGFPSLQEGLEIANTLLEEMPIYSTKEILILYGSIRTCDKKNIIKTLNKLIENHIYVNCISISPEMYILKHICEKTNGIYKICIDKDALMEALLNLAEVPLWMVGMEPQMIQVCFPSIRKSNIKMLCSCHDKLCNYVHICNFCNSYICKIPSKCKICGINLIFIQDLSHVANCLKASPTFIDIKNENNKYKLCYACNDKLGNDISQCVKCKRVFCINCDIYIHEVLNQCPHCVFIGS